MVFVLPVVTPVGTAASSAWATAGRARAVPRLVPGARLSRPLKRWTVTVEDSAWVAPLGSVTGALAALTLISEQSGATGPSHRTDRLWPGPTSTNPAPARRPRPETSRSSGSPPPRRPPATGRLPPGRPARGRPWTRPSTTGGPATGRLVRRSLSTRTTAFSTDGAACIEDRSTGTAARDRAIVIRSRGAVPAPRQAGDTPTAGSERMSGPASFDRAAPRAVSSGDRAQLVPPGASVSRKRATDRVAGDRSVPVPVAVALNCPPTASRLLSVSADPKMAPRPRRESSATWAPARPAYRSETGAAAA